LAIARHPSSVLRNQHSRCPLLHPQQP